MTQRDDRLHEGLALCEAGRLEEAIACFQRILDENYRDIEALFHRAGAEARLGRIDKARLSYMRVDDVGLNDPTVRDLVDHARRWRDEHPLEIEGPERRYYLDVYVMRATGDGYDALVEVWKDGQWTPTTLSEPGFRWDLDVRSLRPEVVAANGIPL